MKTILVHHQELTSISLMKSDSKLNVIMTTKDSKLKSKNLNKLKELKKLDFKVFSADWVASEEVKWAHQIFSEEW